MKSLIAARQEPVIVRTYSQELNSFGQMHQTSYTERTVNMFLTKYTQTKDSDIRYNNVVLIGLTKDNSVTDRDNIIYNGKEYKCTHTIEGVGPIRWNQVFLEIYEN